jgi:uncharacterized protein YqeY
MSIMEKVQQDMKDAMRAQDAARLGAIRLIRAELLKAEKDKGLKLDEAREMAVLQTMLKQRRDSIEQFEQAGRAEMAAREAAEAVIIQSYLPEQLGEAEIDAIIGEALTQAGAVDPKQMGKLMGTIMGKLKQTGKPFDGKAVNEKAKARLEASA